MAVCVGTIFVWNLIKYIYIYIHIELWKPKKVWQGYKNTYIRWHKVLFNRIVAILSVVGAFPNVCLADGGRWWLTYVYCLGRPRKSNRCEWYVQVPVERNAVDKRWD